MFTFTEFLTPYIQLSLCVTTSSLLRRNEQFFTNLLSKYFQDSSLVPIWKGCREKGALKNKSLSIEISNEKKEERGRRFSECDKSKWDRKQKNGRKNSFLKIQKKKKKAGNEIADFQNATNAKITRFWKYKKKWGNEVAAFQNATNICGRSYCCTL